MAIKSKLICVVLEAALIVALTTVVYAATLSGVVRDTNSQPIKDALVVVGNSNTMTGADGAYSLTVTVPATINLMADAFGYARRIYPSIQLIASSTKDITLLSAPETSGFNGDFEIAGTTNTGAFGWEILSLYVNSSYSRITTDNNTPGGSACIRMHPNSPDSYCSIQTPLDSYIPVCPTYYYTIWCYAKSNGRGSGQLRLDWYDAAKSVVQRIDTTKWQTEPTTWTRFVVIANIKGQANPAFLRFRYSHSDVLSDVFLDDVSWDYFNPVVSGNSIRTTKDAGDSAAVTLTGKKVTAVGGSLGAGVMYVQEPDSYFGIRVEGVTEAVQPGNIVEVTGTLSTTVSDERCISATSVVPTEGSAPGAIGASNKALKTTIPAGTLVRAWGAVQPDTANSFYLNDGTGPIKVIGTPPMESFCTLTAVVSRDNGIVLIEVQ